MAAPLSVVKQLVAVLEKDRRRLKRIDDYLHGEHDDPYMPESADAEYKLLAKRAVSNWMPLLVGTPAQALYVDSFRRGTPSKPADGPQKPPPEWDHWQRSRLDARQAAVYRGALGYGHSFTITEKGADGRVTTKGLSALKTSALFEDPANDDVPYAAFTVTSWGDGDKEPGRGRAWIGRRVHAVTFKQLSDVDSVRVDEGKPHGALTCPVTRFAASVDLEGRTVGVIEPMIALQNRINQTVFDLLVAQTYGSFKVRFATGMAPPMVRDEDGELVLDDQGQPQPVKMDHNARRFLFAEDDDVSFGSLDETPLGGFIDSIDMSIRHLAAVSQTPPHHLLGQIANLSAEALLAAETALARKVQEFRTAFGESWERVFRLAAELNGDLSSQDDVHGEVVWRDMESRSLAQSADALGKLADQLGVPKKGLWARVPGVTATELSRWDELADDEDSIGQLASAVTRATGGRPRSEVTLANDRTGG